MLRAAKLGLALLALAAAAPAVSAQEYPARPVKIIVPFGVGGPADVFARVMGQHLTDALKQPFVIEPRPGAGSVIGTDLAAKSPADGYTLLMMSSTHTTNESLIQNKPYQLMRDFTAVALVNSSDLVMVVPAALPAKNLVEFIALAKEKPGSMNYASSGPGTPYHMAGELFKAMSGTTIQHVPHKASGDARSSVIGGHVQMMFDAVTTMMETVKGGQVRALGTTSLKRTTVLPDVPTVSEAGLPGYEATIWIGMMAPAATPKPIVEKLNSEILKILARPDIKQGWAKQGADPANLTAAQFEAFLHKDIEKWAGVVKATGATVK